MAKKKSKPARPLANDSAGEKPAKTTAPKVPGTNTRPLATGATASKAVATRSQSATKANAATKTPAKVAGRAMGKTAAHVSAPASPTAAAQREAIERLAYQKWEEAGRPDGDGSEFWTAAEAEIMGRAKP